MNSEVQISKPTLEEWEAFRELRLLSLQDSPIAFLALYDDEKLLPEEKWRTRIEGSLKGEVGEMIVARADGKLIGLVGVQYLQPAKLRHVAHIWGTYVDPKYRGQGIGRKLMEKIIEMAKAHQGIKKIKIEVIPEQISAYELYKKLGFEMIGVSHNEVCSEGNYYDEILMEMLLGE